MRHAVTKTMAGTYWKLIHLNFIPLVYDFFLYLHHYETTFSENTVYQRIYLNWLCEAPSFSQASSKNSLQILSFASLNFRLWIYPWLRKVEEGSDSLRRKLGLYLSRFVPELFFAFKNKDYEIAVVIIVDDVLIIAEKLKAHNFISSVKSQCKLGTIAFFLFNRSHFIQDTDFAIHIHRESNLKSLISFPISYRRPENSNATYLCLYLQIPF